MTDLATFSDEDLRYIRAEYRTLDELCADRAEHPADLRALIDAGRLPPATYVLPDGVEYFPPDYLTLLVDAGTVDELPGRFRARYLAAAADLSSAEADLADDWAGYLTGQFGVCLWRVEPEAMVEKNRLIRRIEALVAEPWESDGQWRTDVRGAVEALDALERPFTDFDLRRWGDTSRARHIDRVRARFPAVFRVH